MEQQRSPSAELLTRPSDGRLQESVETKNTIPERMVRILPMKSMSETSRCDSEELARGRALKLAELKKRLELSTLQVMDFRRRLSQNSAPNNEPAPSPTDSPRLALPVEPEPAQGHVSEHGHGY